MSDAGQGPPPGGDTPWWAQDQSGATPSWWQDAPNQGAGWQQQPPPRMPFTPGSDPAYAQTYWRGAPQANAKGAVAALVLGILSLVLGVCGCGVILGPIAIYQGSQARFRIRSSNGRLGGNGMALAGMLLGGLAVLWFVVGLILYATGSYHVVYVRPSGS
jgi:hypothetical protein